MKKNLFTIAFWVAMLFNSNCLAEELLHEDPTIAYQEYPQFMRIQSLVNINGQYIILALTDIDSSLPYARYILSESTSSLYPLEKKNSLFRSIGLERDNNNTINLYGMSEESVITPDAFIAEINID